MKAIKKILFPTDFSDCANQALPHAVFLAEQFGAELHMLHALLLHDEDPNNPLYNFPQPDEVYRTVAATAESRMGELLRSHRSDQLVVREVQRRGLAPGVVILEYAQEASVDLVVMATHGRRGLGRLFLGSVAEEVVRLAPCPVLCLHGEEAARSVDSFDTILVPVDFSDYSRRALQEAIELADVYGSKLHLLHVLQQPVYPQVYYPGTSAVLAFDYAEVSAQAKKGLVDLIEEYPELQGRTEAFVLEGYPATAIAEHVKKHDVDLVVISTHGLTGLSHLLLGSVAERVVRMAECPVLTVKVVEPSDAEA